MSKSIEDYRSIIKILKLQLLKIRQENAGLSHTLGLVSENETSSYSPKIAHYSQSSQPFAKNILAFLNFAHKCEALGLTPQMIFRIADKKRDKKVSVSSFAQIVKRLKLRMGDMEINQLTNLITRANSIIYEEYLQCLSAFQINSQKYPAKSSRTYVQLCLLKFAKQFQKIGEAEKVYKLMNQGNDKPYLAFQDYAAYIKRNVPVLQQFQIVSVFVSLDLMSECRLQKSIFVREVKKAFSIVSKGVNFQEEMAYQKKQDGDKNSKGGNGKKIGVKSNYKDDDFGGSNKGRKRQNQKQDDDQIKEEADTGEEAGNKGGKKVVKKGAAAKEQYKLAKGDSAKVIEQFKKLRLKINDFMDKLLDRKKSQILIRSFTIHDFFQTIRQFSIDAPKAKIMALFRALDIEANGTIDTTELLKLWMRGKQLTDRNDMLYRLLSRHLKQIQFIQPIQRFQVLGIKADAIVDQNIFERAFKELLLDQDEVRYIFSTFIGNQMKVSDFIGKLKSQGKTGSSKKFTKLDKKVYDDFKLLLGKINSKRKAQTKKFRKLMRLQTGQKSPDNQYWATIFTDQWACWQQCLQIAYKLQSFWRDPEFGPTKADPSGYRSIVGNESNVPPGLPYENQIGWLSYQDILANQNSSQKVQFLQTIPNANDVVQGKLGDCWFVSSLSIIAKNQQYIKGAPVQKCRKKQQMATFGVSPFLFKFFIKYGIYVFKYYKKFQPVYVIVDQLFPIELSSNQLIFAKSPKPGQQWVAFLQKSYAKLHHSYSNMISGDIAQGLNDLTNALPIKQNLEDGRNFNLDKIKLLNIQGQLMGCSIAAPKDAGVEAPVKLDDQKCGLFYSHAYSIIDQFSLKTKEEQFNLIRVRNPWGHGEWALDWSDHPIDNNPEYQKLAKYQKDIDRIYKDKNDLAAKKNQTKLKPYAPGEDGQFLMNFSDFNKVYTSLFTGYVFQSSHDCSFIKQKWDQKFPSGVCKIKNSKPQQRIQCIKNNHQYFLEIKNDNTDVLMYVIQEDGRLYRGQKYPYKELCNGINIFCFRLGKENSLQEFDAEKLVVKNFKFEVRREVNLWTKLQAGKYAIIPCKLKNNIIESDFQFRIYSDKQITIRKIKGTNNKFSPLPETSISQIQNSSYSSFIELISKNSK